MTPRTVERFVGGREVQAKDVLALAQEHEVRMVDFKFTDLPGTCQTRAPHWSIPSTSSGRCRSSAT